MGATSVFFGRARKPALSRLVLFGVAASTPFLCAGVAWPQGCFPNAPTEAVLSSIQGGVDGYSARGGLVFRDGELSA